MTSFHVPPLLLLMVFSGALQLAASTAGVSMRKITPFHLYPSTQHPPLEITLPPDFTEPPAIHNRSSGSANYLITFPKKAIPGFNFTIGFESFRSQPYYVEAKITERVYVTQDDRNYNRYTDFLMVKTYGYFARGYPGLLHIPIPEKMVPATQYSYFYWSLVDSLGGTLVENRLHLVSMATAIMIQTDKAIYKPGQIVNYRVFAAYSDLQLYDGNFTIEIKDPNGNIIQYRQDVPGVEGVVEGALGLSDQTLFGDWKIFVRIEKPTDSPLTYKSFTVQNYRLPRFEVVVDLPSYMLINDAQLQGTVKATYTFGQPVKGMAEVHVMMATARPDNCGNEPRHVEISFAIDGEANFTIPVNDIQRITNVYQGSEIKVEATVKEELTGISLKGSSVVTFYSSQYKVRVLDNTPSVFKPGLPFSVFAQGTLVDDSPVVGEETSISMHVMAQYTVRVDIPYLYGVNEFSGAYPLPVQVQHLPPSGVVRMEVDIPSNATFLDVYVDFKGMSQKKTIEKAFSMSNNFLQLTLLDKDLQSGQTATFQARATEPITKLRYQIVSRGNIYDSKVIDAQGQQSLTFEVALTPDMAPTAHMMAYYIRQDLELVPDSIAFNIDGIFNNKVSLEMSTNMSEPHGDLNVTLRADPGSVVHILTTDQSVLLLKSGNDVTPGEISSFVGLQITGEKPVESTFALSLSRKTSLDTLNGVGLGISSNGSLGQSYKPHPTVSNNDPSITGPPVLNKLSTTMGPWYTGETPTAYPPWYTGETPTAYPPWYTGETPTAYPPWYTGPTPDPLGGVTTGLDQLNNQNLKEVDRIRQFFPETWLWLSTPVGANGSATIHTTVPDTITSWITTAFATNNRTGLGITPSSTKLTVFRSFFVSLTMPGSVVRGEHVVIQASVFNYLPSDISVLISLPGSRDYTSIVIADDGSESVTNGDVQYAIIVKSQEQTAVYFPVIPFSVGAVDIEVSARSTLAADAVKRPLMVEAEGVPSEFTVPVFIDLAENTTDSFTQTFPISLPDDVIDGSARMHVKVTGDVMGPSIHGLDNLLRMPKGCGEQNMMKLAPDLYIANYLNITGQLSSSMSQRVKYLIDRGYQSQLTYQRKDRSFSAFGNRDGTGSTWLTAFVIRVFHQIRPYTYVDDNVIQQAIYWFERHQNNDGSFNEFGYIWDQEMMNFKDHSPGLTSFVLLALLENDDMFVDLDMIGNATAFLENNYNNITDDDYLSVALTCLALTKTGSPVADTLFKKLMSKSTTEHGMTFWKVPARPPRINVYSRWRPVHVRARPIDILVTSYALLVFTARGMFEEGMSVLHWLTRQRNPYGGFSSTQDTVVGLQALSGFVQGAVPAGYNLHVDVRAPHTDVDFNVTSSNAMVLQSKDLAYIPTEVTFNAAGKGLAVAQLDVFFNVEADLGDPAFDVSIVLMDDTLNHFKIMICTRWLLEGESGMVTQEVGIPSGFAPDMSSVGDMAGIKRTEQRGRFMDVYFDKITKASLCYTVMFDRQNKVAHSQPVYVITQEYYEPSNRATAKYHPSSLRYSQICDVCPDCCK